MRPSFSSAIGLLLSLYAIGVVLAALGATVLAPQVGLLTLAGILLPHLSLEPITTQLRCDVPGDHCVLIATIALPGN